jgi:hypothetical protein
MGEILLGIITMPDDTRYFIASSTYIGDVEPIGGGTAVPTTFHGDIPSDKPTSWRKERGFFVWGRESVTEIGETWLMNEPEFNQTSGRYDDLLLLPSRDAILDYYIVEEGEAFSSAIQIGSWLIDSTSNPSNQYLVISAVDRLALIDKNTVHEYFPDTIQYEPNRLQPRPIQIGAGYQVPSVKIDDVDNIFEVHFEPDVTNLISVFDRADPFNPAAPDNDYTEGVQSTGGYGFNLANPHSGTVTHLAVGGPYDPGGVNGVSNRFQFFTRKLLEDFGGIDPSDIDTSSLDAIHSDWNQRYGVYISSGTNIREILEQAMVGHCGYAYQKNDGKITFGYVRPPAVTEDHELNAFNIASDGIKISLDRAEGLSDAVAARKNWYVFSFDEIKDVGIDSEDKEVAIRDFVFKYRSSTTTSGGSAFHESYAHARHGDYIETLCQGTTNAETLITHLEGQLYNVERHFHVFERVSETVLEALTIEIGETMKLTDDRYLPAGMNTLITAISGSDLLNKTVEFETWG